MQNLLTEARHPEKEIMSATTIDTALAKQMVDAAVISGAAIIGKPGGWTVLLKMGLDETPLCAQRTNKLRVWRSLDRCVEYLKAELRITKFDLLDATHHSDIPLVGNSRADASVRLRIAHAAAGHDTWFRAQVAQAIAEADSLGAEWISHEDANASWANIRDDLRRRTKASAG